jgi:uncharacterized protein YdeI (YjbR/CyaY-like superfamily)
VDLGERVAKTEQGATSPRLHGPQRPAQPRGDLALAELAVEAAAQQLRLLGRKTGEQVRDPPLVDEAVDLGLCYGWISGQRKSYDEVYYLQKYVPRRPRSRWSQVNVAKVEELIAAGRMRPSGLAEVEAAKADGRWGAAYESQRNATVPPDLAAALAAKPQAAQAFDALSRTQQYAVILKLVTARTATARVAQLRKAMTTLDARDAL